MFEDVDFEGTGNNGNTNSTDNQNNGKQEDVTAINGKQDKQDINKDNTTDGGKGDVNIDKTTDDNPDLNNNDGNLSTGELSEGDSIEVDGVIYTVDKNGNLIDKNNNIFKNANEVKDWLSTFDKVEKDTDDKSVTIDKIKDSFGITITDENGKEIEFTNDIDGITSYCNSVVDLKSKDIQEATINKLFSDNPLLKQFIDYCQVMGTPRGFGEIPDRSGIQLDKDNEQQLEYIIRMAATEFGNKSINDNYIKYLKSSGGLYDEAKIQLDALIEKDKNYRTELENVAKENRLKEENAIREYWNNVNKVIESGNIAGYKLPKSFIKEVNGTKVTLTTNDFYNYLSRQIEVDAEGNRMTGYQKDLNSLTDEELLNRELLDAWLMFTGGSYKDLVNMAINEEQVRKLRFKSKEHSNTSTVRINKANTGKTNIEDIVL